MRARLALLPLALALTAIASGCGSKYELPTERRQGRVVPANGSYQMIQTWHGMDGIQDILLTQGTGSQLYVLFNHGGSGAAPRGEVKDYFLSRPDPLGHSMSTLLSPAALTAGGDGTGGTANRIYVLDQGDTCLAKTRLSTGTCGGLFITDLRYYWRVREYGLLGGDTISTFTDTTLAWVNGIAADDEGSVYVSGVAIVLTQSQQSQFLFDRSFVFRVYKYRRGPRYPGVTPGDHTMPGANWHRDTTFFHTQGSGVGYVDDPRGMAWSGLFPRGLYVADAGNNSGQKLNDADTTGFFRYEQDGDGVFLAGPDDVALDAAGYVYINDAGNGRVLRFDAGGGFVQRVDVEPDDAGATLLTPVALAASDSIVYVADRGRSEIVRYQRRK
jgi:hypothetical protein